MFVRISVAVVLSFVCVSALGQAQPTVNPGLWEVTIHNEVPAGGPPAKQTLCISPEQAAQMTVLPRVRPESDCQSVVGPGGGAVLQYTTTCEATKVTNQVRMVFTGDHYEGTMTAKQDQLTTRQQYTGRRLGACPEPEAEQ